MVTPRPWQADVICELFIYDQIVVWVTAPACTGKTWLADYLVDLHRGEKPQKATPELVNDLASGYPSVMVFDLDLPNDIDSAAFVRLVNASSFSDPSISLPKILCLATFEPPKGMDETECHIMTIKN